MKIYIFGDWGLGPIPNPQSPYILIKNNNKKINNYY